LQDICTRQPIEQRALAGIGITHQCHCGHRYGFATLPLLSPNALYRVEIDLELIDPALNFAAVCLKLRLARPSRSDAAAQLRHGFAASGKARQHVFELRQLHLQLAFARSCVARKDIKDQLGAIEHTALKRTFKVAQLGRAQIVIEEHEVGASRTNDAGDFLHFARANQGCRIGPGAALHDLRGNLSAGASHQLTKLRKRFVRVQSGTIHCRWFPGVGDFVVSVAGCSATRALKASTHGARARGEVDTDENSTLGPVAPTISIGR
jgi:hypothetical protein